MKSIHKILIVFLLTHFSYQISAQKSTDKKELKQYEDSLKTIAPQILYGDHDFNKYEASEKFYRILTEALTLKNAFNYPFDSLKTISILKSPDEYFRIFTWNLRRNDGSYDYFGLVQINPKKANGEALFKLTNSTNKDTNATHEISNIENWYGASYYKIVQKKSNKNVYYTLLGWDGNNNLTTRKIIDVIVFDKNGQPEFGASIFQTKTDIKTRFIIEYAAYVSSSLKYEKQFMHKGKNKKWMIVFDRVSPLSPMLAGQYQFYVPDTDTYDAFIFENGVWKFYEDVDARNPKIKTKKLNTKKKPEQKIILQKDK